MKNVKKLLCIGLAFFAQQNVSAFTVINRSDSPVYFTLLYSKNKHTDFDITSTAATKGFKLSYLLTGSAKVAKFDVERPTMFKLEPWQQVKVDNLDKRLGWDRDLVASSKYIALHQFVAEKGAATDSVYRNLGSFPSKYYTFDKEGTKLVLSKHKDFPGTKGNTAAATVYLDFDEKTLQESMPIVAGQSVADEFVGAAMFDDKASIKHFMSEDIDINYASPKLGGQTALHAAAAAGNIEIVKFLLNFPAVEVDKQDNKGYTPLMDALENGHKKIADMLIKHGADVHTLENNKGETAYVVEARVRAKKK